MLQGDIENGNYDPKDYPEEFICKCGKKEVCEKDSLSFKYKLCVNCILGDENS